MTENNIKLDLLASTSWNQSESENITVVQDGLDKKQKWTRVGVMCLLEILWEQYDTAKDSFIPQRIIYENASKEMRKNGFNYTKDELQKKYSNLTGTYQRIKAKQCTTKTEDKMKWPYFEIMKEIRRKERDCRLDLKRLSQPQKRKLGPHHSPTLLKSTFEDLYPPIKRERTAFSNNLSIPSGGVAISSADDCLAFSNQWETKRFALEDYKMQLIETLFKDVKQQRSEAEEDALIHLQMRNTKNRHLKQIVAEMGQMRMEVKKELSSLSESINDLISALRSSSSKTSF